MGYSVIVKGKLKFDKKPEKGFVEYFNAFANTRHAVRYNKLIKKYFKNWKYRCLNGYLGPDGLFFVCDDTKDKESEKTYKHVNEVNKYCPSFWCRYEINNKDELEPVGEFRYQTQIYWLEFIIENFMKPLNYKLSGKLTYQGEVPYDSGIIIVNNNKMTINNHKNVKWGLLCENEKTARKLGYDKTTGYNYTGLDTYLKTIFNGTNDWKYKKPYECVTNEGKKYKITTTYRSKKLKKIVMFYDVDHYKNAKFIKLDRLNSEYIFCEGKYEIIKIPYFIQLTNVVVRNLFGVKVKEKLFLEDIPSMTAEKKNTPYFMCKEGVKEMLSDFKEIAPDQFEINKFHLEWLDYGTGLSGVEQVEDFILCNVT